MAEFTLNQKISDDSILISKLELSELRLMNDANYPWFILIPQQSNLCEIYDLTDNQQKILMSEINKLAKFIKTHFKADKINIANLGNIVAQLHIHVIARYKDDQAWPDPVWGKYPQKKYLTEQILAIKELFNKY
ncbi:MAG: HIT domain-containing protein [Alphaproteobacteria bacterium]|jgi:diadenosine tetraphosphate (Ap4A) HIT family hydrolase|nr:HIT domain-containing protein [Alphaproteobacteria bacterium]MBT5827415.1 HIT domain-containing protein [Alphaproteobacteria bacterium]